MGAAWLEALGRASLGGACVFALVWSLCRLFPKLHPALRFWLWWLVAARLMIGLALSGVGAIALPVLTPPALQSATPLRPVQQTARPALAPAPVVPAAPQPLRASVRRSAPLPRVPWLLALWAAGVALVLLRDGMAALRLRRRLGRLVPDGDGIVVSAQVASPLVVGLWRPVIVLPVGLGGEERELALLHERAHLRRGDLWLGLVFSAARALFWFLPFAHLAMREGEAAREEACDRLVREMGARPAAYGRLLLRLSTQTPPGGLGMAAIEHRALRRRLLALSEAPSRVSRLALALVGLFGAALLLPWKLTACAVVRPVRPGVPAPRFAIETLSVEALGENYSDAFGINDAGQVVGAASDAQGRGRAFLHDAATGRGRAQPASTTKVRSSSSPTTERSARAAWSSHRTIREWGRAACAGYVASPTRSRTA